MKVCPTCSKEYGDGERFCPEDGSTLRSGRGDIIGSVVADRFHIIKKLGEGGMGAVYLGEHVKMGRKSAIKVMTQGMAADADAIARFNREAENAARINHPNVCAIYDFGETSDGTIYLAMEFIEGEALTDLLEREGALSPKRASHILKQSAQALEAAHELGIVHRDLKPDNIMISRDRDGRDLVKVVDFGIAKAMGGDNEQNVTKTGLVVGTPEYMSPEQLSGDKLDGRSDTYSLALVLYRMLTGVLPFQADTSQEVMIKRLTDDPMPLAAALPGAEFPAALQAAMDRALQRMPGDRYPSAAEFGRDVISASAGMPDVAPRIDTDGATQQFDGGAVFGGATAALPNTQIGAAQAARTAPPKAAAAAPDAARTEPLPAPVVSQPARRPVALMAAAAAAVIVGGGGTMFWLNRDSAPANTPESVALNTGSEAGGVSQDTGVRAPNPNTAPTGNRNPVSADTSTGLAMNPGAPDTGSTPPVVIDTPREDPVLATRTGIAVDVANAADNVFNQMFAVDSQITQDGGPDARVLTALRDTVRAYFENQTVAHKTRADAAYVTALTYFYSGQRAEALTWVQRALAMDGNDQAYQKLLSAIQGSA